MSSPISRKRRRDGDMCAAELQEAAQWARDALADPPDAFDAFDDAVWDLNDTEMAYITISKSVPLGGVLGAFTGATSHQINTMIRNRTHIAQNFEDLRLSCKYKFLSCKPMGLSSDFLVACDVYVRDMHDCIENIPQVTLQNLGFRGNADASFEASVQRIVDVFTRWVRASPSRTYFRKDLLAGNVAAVAGSSPSSSSRHCGAAEGMGNGNGQHRGSETDACDNESAAVENKHTDYRLPEVGINLLSKLGFLRAKRDQASDVYYLSHPKLGRVISALTQARDQIVGIVRKKKYKEISERELYKMAGESFFGSACNDRAKLGEPSAVTAKKSSKPPQLKHTQLLGIRYHIWDLEGSGLLKRVECGGSGNDQLRLVD